MSEALSLAGQVRSITAGESGVRETVEEHFRRIEQHAALNAFISLDREQALLQAEQWDRRLASGESAPPLLGASLGLKDLIDQKGLATTCGSGFYREVPTESATVVRRLEAAGAIILGRTNLHEFAFGFSSENHWFGAVRNPWDPDTSAGGSSGGSAAAVAACVVAGAVGTDTGGSVRVPAAVCGIVGLKVTHGRIPLTGVFPLAPSLDTIGPMTRTVEDAALLYAVMAGHDRTDSWSRDRPARLPAGPARLEGLRVGVPMPWAHHPTDPRLRAAYRQSLDALTDLGAEVVEIRNEILQPPGHIDHAAYGEVAVVHRSWFPARADEYGPEIADRLGDVMATKLGEYVEAQQWQSALRQAAEDAFEEVSVLATPAVAGNRKQIGVDLVDIDGEQVSYRRAFSTYTALVNHLGAPALVLPLDTDGEPPPALQLIAPHWSEGFLLSIGLALEEAGVSRFRPPPAARL